MRPPDDGASLVGAGDTESCLPLHLLSMNAESNRFAELAAASYDAIVEIDDRALVTFWNQAAERLFGYPAAETLGRPLHGLVAPEGLREPFERGFEGFRSTGRGSVVGTTTEFEALRQDGTTIPVELSVTPIRRNGSWGALGIIRDISERKRAEEELRSTIDALRATDAERRRLLDMAVRVQDQGRQTVSAEIRRGPMERLTATRLQLGVLRRRLAGSGEPEELERIDRSLGEAISDLRRLTSDISPASLFHEGLAAALNIELAEMTEEGIASGLDDHFVEEPPPAITAALFRIAHEALANVRNHARATSVDVRLETKDGGFFATIVDDGVGFDPTTVVQDPTGHVGLDVMREQAEMNGGWCRVESLPEAGTRVEVWLPAAADRA